MSASLRTFFAFAIFGLVLLVLPFVFTGNTARTVLSLMCVGIVFALSYNVLLGQTGLLSFGHAVYYGLAGFASVHAMNAIAAAKAPISLPFIPLVGAATGLFFGLVFGWMSTRRAGTVFSMISLGLGELVAASALIMRGVFGGEEGISTNRAKLSPFFGYKFGPQIEVYFLIAAWCFVCVVLMYALTRTPFGRMSNAVRDNPERAEFVGYSTQRVRFIAFCLSAMFAGVAGALSAIYFELVNAQSLGALQSGQVLLMTYVGGIGHFFGPIVGAALITFLQLSLADVTKAWQLYFGLLFCFVVLFWPGGIAGWIELHRPLFRNGRIFGLAPAYGLLALPIAGLLVGLIGLVELTHHMLVEAASEGPKMKLFGLVLDGASPLSWLGVCALLGISGFFYKLAWPRAKEALARAQGAEA
jgi:branched-chain amino acid transport system permease protein